MPPPVEGVSLAGQVVMVTGANTGIGYETAKHFAIRGPAKLIMVCRNEQRGQAALTKLKSETGLENVELWIMDLMLFESVKATKEKVDKLERLDILVENASVGRYVYEVTPDGWESTLQVNVLSAALHIILHLPKMLETAQWYPQLTPRIVFVTSGAHYTVDLPTLAIKGQNIIEYLNGEEYSREAIKSGHGRYAESKLLEVMFIRSLQSHLRASSGPAITCCSVSPGFCHSELTREASGEAAERIRKMKETVALSAEEGSRQVLYAAIGDRDKEELFKGGYVAFLSVQEVSDFILSDEGRKAEEKVWKEIMDVIGRVDSRVGDIVRDYLSA
ncbi:short-chain dehydrogenase [Marasmius fiardii PR-910]|nr:short-chain dehydrogenase [Marasmius fiardii PR-910]